jgi:hypothetical protein
VDRGKLDVLWFSSQPIPGVAFDLNDSVRIKTGAHSGEIASVISLESLEPAPVYMVELADGTDLKVTESDLERAA